MKEEEIKKIMQSALNCEPEEFYKKYKKYKKAEEEFMAIYQPFKEEILKTYANKQNELPHTMIIGGAKVTYVAPSTRTTVDSKKLKEEEPEIAKKYSKITLVSASLRLDEA